MFMFKMQINLQCFFCVSNGHIAAQCPGEGDPICIMLGSV
jgi:hypothetical protein